jgi:U3 small nucleolar RNA-associated protein MPP10
MSELERTNIEGKAWFLQGEVSSTKRPANSLLEVPLDFDHATKQVPVVTQELTDSLEEMIRQRCIDLKWDDPVRKAPPDAKRQKRELEEVDTEKSSKGLGDIYAAEYARTILGVKDDDVEAAKRQEVEALFAKVCNRLDALSNFHFTPKVVADEIAIKPNVPAIQMEEKIPMGVSQEQVTAPQDVLKPKGKDSDLIAEAEMTKEDRNKRRNNKKRRHKENMKKKNAALRAQGLDVPIPTKLPTLKGGKVEKAGKGKGKGETAGGGTEVKTGAYAKSSTLFRALQEEALGTIAGWKQEDGQGKKSKKSGGGTFKL